MTGELPVHDDLGVGGRRKEGGDKGAWESGRDTDSTRFSLSQRSHRGQRTDGRRGGRPWSCYPSAPGMLPAGCEPCALTWASGYAPRSSSPAPRALRLGAWESRTFALTAVSLGSIATEPPMSSSSSSIA